MTLIQAVKSCAFSKFGNIKGRASRSEFWWFFLVFFAVSAAIQALFIQLVHLQIFDAHLLRMIGLAISAILLVPLASAAIRRLHDRNMPTSVFLLFVILFTVLPFLFNQHIASLLTTGLTIALLVMLVLPGTPGPNRYGLPE